MGILQRQRKLLQKLIDYSYSFGQYIGELKKIKNKTRKKMINSVSLSIEEKKKIDSFYKENYGKKVGYKWHRLYQSYTGKYNEKYLPETIYSSKLEPLLNPYDYRKVLDDKILLNVYTYKINNVRIPNSIAYSYKNIKCDANNNIITQDDIVNLIYKTGDVIVKPSQDTNSGVGVMCINRKEYKSKTEISNLLEKFHYPYIVQEHIVQHDELSKLNSSSINTFRITTYILNGKIYHFPVVLRIGTSGSLVDNSHAGGIFVHVNDNGILDKYAYTGFQKKFNIHPDSKIEFENYKVSFVEELIKCAEKMHLNTPQLGIISWDLTVDKDGFFVLIEANTQSQSIWFSQIIGEPAFGDNTSEILRLLSKRGK